MKQSIQASVSLADLFGHSGESTDLMSQSVYILISRIQDMVNDVLPDGYEVRMEWRDLALGEDSSKTGTISVEAESEIMINEPDLEVSRSKLRIENTDLKTIIGRITTETEELRKKYLNQLKRAEAAEKALGNWEKSYESDPVDVGWEDATERTLEL